MNTMHGDDHQSTGRRLRLHRRSARAAVGGDGGAVLLIVLLVMLTLLSLGVMAIWMTGGNLQISGNMNLRTQALYCAQAGIERARAFLVTAPSATVPQFLTARLAASGQAQDNVPTGVDTSGRPNGVGAVLVDGTGAMANVAYPPGSFGRTTAAAMLMGSYTVWIRNDLSDVRQANYTTDTNSTVIIRSQCLGPDGRTNATLEVTFIPPLGTTFSPLAAECLDSGKNNDDANTNTVHCTRGI
jgi:hypothetical protein